MSEINYTGLNLNHPPAPPEPFPRREPWANFQYWLQWVFQIGLPDEGVRAAATVGDLHDIIAEELQVAYETDDESAARSLTAVVTQRLQNAMEILFDTAPAIMSPSAEMDQLIPRRRRREAWTELAEEMDLRLPDLEIAERTIRRSGFLVRSAFMTFVSSLLLCLLAAGMSAGTFGLPRNLSSALGALAGGGMLAALLLFLASTFGGKDITTPPSCHTMGDTVLTLVHLNPVRLAWGRLDATEIWQVLQVALADRFDMPVDDVTRDLPLANAVMRSELPLDDV